MLKHTLRFLRNIDLNNAYTGILTHIMYTVSLILLLMLKLWNNYVDVSHFEFLIFEFHLFIYFFPSLKFH